MTSADAYRDWMEEADVDDAVRRLDKLLTAEWCVYQAIWCKGCEACGYEPRELPVRIQSPESMQWLNEVEGLTLEQFWTEALTRNPGGYRPFLEMVEIRRRQQERSYGARTAD